MTSEFCGTNIFMAHAALYGPILRRRHFRGACCRWDWLSWRFWPHIPGEMGRFECRQRFRGSRRWNLSRRWEICILQRMRFLLTRQLGLSVNVPAAELASSTSRELGWKEEALRQTFVPAEQAATS